jgi:hypothetical protein
MCNCRHGYETFAKKSFLVECIVHRLPMLGSSLIFKKELVGKGWGHMHTWPRIQRNAKNPIWWIFDSQNIKEPVKELTLNYQVFVNSFFKPTQFFFKCSCTAAEPLQMCSTKQVCCLANLLREELFLSFFLLREGLSTKHYGEGTAHAKGFIKHKNLIQFI